MLRAFGVSYEAFLLQASDALLHGECYPARHSLGIESFLSRLLKMPECTAVARCPLLAGSGHW